MSNQHHYQWVLLLISPFFLQLCFLPLATGAPLTGAIPSNIISTLPSTIHDLNTQSVILSVILFLTGGYLCFVGGIYQRLTIFIVGFYAGSNLTYVILLNAKIDDDMNFDTLFLVVTMMVGILTGRMLLCCFFLAVYLVGVLMGYFSALWLLSWVTNGLIQSNWGRAILIIVFAVVGVILATFFERLLMIMATAFIGSFAIFIGLDVYLMTGFAESVMNFLRAWKTTAATSSLSSSAKATSSMIIAEATPQLRGMLIGCIGLAFIGALVQFCQLRRKSPPTTACNQLRPYGRPQGKRF